MKRGCCIYDEEKNKIVVFYEGELEKRQIVKSLGTGLASVHGAKCIHKDGPASDYK